MAKTNNLDSAKKAMNSAAMKEAGTKKVPACKVTQTSGNKPIHLKKFPQEWHDLLKADHVDNITEYIMTAVRERMKRDGLI